MISRIDGELVGVRNGRVELRCGSVTYELLVPAADQERLGGLAGEPVSFHTMHYLESQAQGAAYLPRLIGFPSAEARAFFEVLTSVKGLGPRRALRALAVPFPTIAAAIAAADLRTLTALPEIGRRIAETMVAQLRGKVDRFVEVKPQGGVAGLDPLTVADAVATLMKLGEPQAQAQRLVEQALAEDPSLATPGDLASAAVRLKDA